MAASWITNIRADVPWGSYEERQRGQGERPWWLSQQEWERRQDRTAARNQFKQAQADFNDWKDDFDLEGRNQANRDRLASLQQYYDTQQPQFTEIKWSDYQDQHQGYQDNISRLLAQIEAGPTTADEDAAFQQMARLYGMTPEQFREMQGYFNVAPGSEAQLEQQKKLRDMANELALGDTAGNAQFDAAMRSQQRAAEAGMGKQLETIFADRGGLGGFAAAQDFTLQMSDQMMQQRSQYMLQKQSEAAQALNADINRKYQMVQSGQLTAKQFLDDRWANLQQSFENNAAMSKQIMEEYAMRSDVNRADFQTNFNAFLGLFGAQKDLILTQMGIDQNEMDLYQKMYDMSIKPYLDMWATSA